MGVGLAIGKSSLAALSWTLHATGVSILSGEDVMQNTPRNCIIVTERETYHFIVSAGLADRTDVTVGPL